MGNWKSPSTRQWRFKRTSRAVERGAVAEPALEVVARYDYSPFGVRSEIGTGTFDCEFGYTGHFHHEDSELFLTYFRGYDAELGRWLSPDPLGEEGGLNLYGYVQNDPLKRWDPLGLTDARSAPGNVNQLNQYLNTAIRNGDVHAIRMLRQGQGLKNFKGINPNCLKNAENAAQSVRHLMQHHHKGMQGYVNKQFGGDAWKAWKNLQKAGAQICKRKGAKPGTEQSLKITLDGQKATMTGFFTKDGVFKLSNVWFP